MMMVMMIFLIIETSFMVNIIIAIILPSYKKVFTLQSNTSNNQRL